jgi:hypothetical protein
MAATPDITSDPLQKRVLKLPQSIEEETIPPEIILRAQEQIQEFFREELPTASDESREWVMQQIAPGMAIREKHAMEVDISRVDKFLEELDSEVQEKIAALEEINFSRGHEKDKRTYPTTEEIAPMISWLKNLDKSYDKYRKAPNFKKEFKRLFSPYVESLLLRVKHQALLSRNAQLQELILNKDSMDEMDDFEGEKFIVQTHISRLTTNHEQPLLEFRDLLNLSGLPWLERKSTRDEIKAFQFLAQFVKTSQLNCGSKKLRG